MIESRVGRTHDNEDSGQEQETCALCPCPFKVLPLGKQWLGEQQRMFQGAEEWEAVYHRSLKAQGILTTEKVETNWPYEALLWLWFCYHTAVHPV